MRIDQIELTNFKNFGSLNVPFKPGINIFVGGNGSGKTSILEAINVALGGFFASQEPKMQRPIEYDELKITNGKREASATIKAKSIYADNYWWRSINRATMSNDNKHLKPALEYGHRIYDLFEITDDKTIAPIIVYYSTQRLFKDANSSNKQKYDPANGRNNGYLLCLKETSINSVLREWLGNAVTKRATLQIKEIENVDLILENVEQAIRKTLIMFLDLPDNFSLKIYQDPELNNEVFVNYDAEHDLPLNYYSDGFRNLLFLIIDLVWRSSQLNPWLTLDEITKSVFGVVTIDEIDLHLHPKWQAKTTAIIQSFFPKVQFFITTHSPTVIANFNMRIDEKGDNIDEIYLLENNSLKIIENSFYGKDINSVLTNPMDAYIRAPEIKLLIEDFYKIAENEQSTDVDYEKINSIVEKLSQYLDGADKEMIKIYSIAENIKNRT